MAHAGADAQLASPVQAQHRRTCISLLIRPLGLRPIRPCPLDVNKLPRPATVLSL